MANPLVTVIGAGNVGATTAQRIVEQGLADVWLVDIIEGLPQGKALDLAQAAPVVGHDMVIQGTNDYADTAGSDVIVVEHAAPTLYWCTVQGGQDGIRGVHGRHSLKVGESALGHIPVVEVGVHELVIAVQGMHGTAGLTSFESQSL